MATSAASLRTLIDNPFELLLEMERRARAMHAGQSEEAQAGTEWVGVSFRLGGETFMVAREETREVLSVPTNLTRVPGAKLWIRGLANIRGQLLPVVDLRAFLGGGAATIGRAARILVANHRDVPAGLLVDEVLGFRKFNDSEFNAQIPTTILQCDRYLAGAFRRSSEVCPVFGLRGLLESEEFLTGAAN
ncbi:MAG TPA: chemotaxis protein CheW [Steroidobacteraceae bacterium]|nr:chemotaxis protein CheW [Steroidobacteraceae bacterium]